MFLTEHHLLTQRGAAYSVVVDDVLTCGECPQFIKYAEASSVTQSNADSTISIARGWTTALVNTGRGKEAHALDYRNSQRIIWDSQDLMNRLWARVAQSPSVEDELRWLNAVDASTRMPWTEAVIGATSSKWKFSRLNDRMRFLRYEPGMFFRGAHKIVCVAR